MQTPEIHISRTGGHQGSHDPFEGDLNAVSRKPHGQRPTGSMKDFVPKVLREPMLRFVAYLTVFVIALASISLATWTVSDPSITFANRNEPENWLGYWGASFADFSMQFFGFAAIVLLAVPMIWCLYIINHRTMSPLRTRLAYWFGAIAMSSAALGCVSIPEGWPLEVGLGGVLGDAVLSIPRAFTGSYPGGIFAVILFCLFGALGGWLLKYAYESKGVVLNNADAAPHADSSDILFDQDEYAQINENTGRDWGGLIAAPLGFVMHLFYSVSSYFRNRRKVETYQTPMAVHHARGDVHPMDHEVVEQVASEYPESNSHQVYENEFAPEYNDYQPEVDHASDPMPWDEIDPVEVPSPQQEEPQVLERAHVDAPSIGASEEPKAPAVQSTPIVSKRAKPKSTSNKFDMPSLDLLSEQTSLVEDPSLSTEALEQCARTLEGVLEDFGVKGQILKVRPGPVVTLYELEPAPGVKSSRVIGLAEDIARSMSAIAARVAVVPGRNAIGIELPNKRRETVYLREQLSSKEFKNTKAKLAMCLGKTIGGEPVIADLAKMPHLLMAGTTGSGKSVGINTMILSLLYRLGPDKCKMIMIDPKMLELSIYDGIPHLLTPVVVDPKKAVVALKWTVREMEDRYKKMSKVGVRNIDGFNTRIAEANAKGEVITRTVQTGFDQNTGEAIYEHEELDLEPLPFIVVIIDEMADLMMVAGKDIEGTVQRLAQMARAAGIHVIMATQRPSVDVITGTIKANFPTRISFQVTSKIDSRTILGEMGAEQLLGMGDMLYMAGGGRITRVHGPFVSDQEVEDIVNHLKSQGIPQYLEAVTEEDEESAEGADGGAAGGGNLGNSDDPYDQAVAVVLRDRKVSTSYIQRRLSIGYNRAASLIERMEQEGLISAANHAGKREILVPAEDETI